MFFDVFRYFPHWPAPSDHPESRGDGNWVATGIFLTAATIAVWVRLWQRVYVRRWFGLDDLLILLSWLCSIGITVLVGIGNARYGWNGHLWDLDMSLYSHAAYILYISRLFWGMATSFVRLSVICLYYRLLKAANAPRKYFIVNHIMLASTIILLLYYIFSQVFACTPIHAYWAWPPIENAKCMNDGLSLMISAAVNTASEFAVATLPLVAIFCLRVDQRQQWAVIGVLCLGYLVVIAGSMRTFFLWKVFFDSWDLTWWAGPQWITTEVELDTAILCACAAPLRPVATRLYRKVRGIRQEYPEKAPRSWFASQTLTNHSEMTDSTVANKYEDINQWTTMMSRTIDLEGIRTDGFGYSVKITGPAKPEPMQRLQENLEKFGLMSPSKTNLRQRPASRAHSTRQLPKVQEITAETEVDVRESWHETKDSSKGWGMPVLAEDNGPGWENIEETFTNFLTYQGGDLENHPPARVARRPSPDPSEWSAELSQAPEPMRLHRNRPRDLSMNPNFFESAESLDALPQMPQVPPTTRPKR